MDLDSHSLDRPEIVNGRADPNRSAADLAPDDVVALLARLELLEEHFQATLEAEKLASLAEWAAGAGHEINNPLAVITGRAQLLARDEPDPQRRRELAVIRAQAQRVHAMIADLMLFARPPEPQFAACDLARLLQQLVQELQPRADVQQVRLLLDSPAELELEADPAQLAVAIRAVCDNSLDAMPTGGQLIITARSASADAPDSGQQWVEVLVTDSGPGISAEVRRHLFDPYFSGRQAGRGLGMGLAKCWRIVTQHAGNVSVANEAGAGATVAIRLPRQH